MGWRLLLDEHLPLQKMASIGPSAYRTLRTGQLSPYGNLAKAMQGAEQYPFKILMSHDPSHWDRK